MSTIVLQLWQRNCVDAKRRLVRLEKHCFPSSLVACLRANKTMFVRVCFTSGAPADGERPRARSKCSSYIGATQRFRRPFYGTLTALLYRPVRRDWNNVSSWRLRKPRKWNQFRSMLREEFCLFFFFFSSFFPPSSPPLRLDITLRLSRQPLQCDRPDDRGAVSRDLSPK